MDSLTASAIEEAEDVVTEAGPDNRPPVYYEVAEDGGKTVVFRASGLDGCDNAMVALLQGMSPSPPPKMLMEKFNEGHLMEPVLLGWLESKGFVLRLRQGAVEVGVGEVDGVKIIIRGKYDCLACETDGDRFEDGKPMYVVDAKALSKTLWGAFEKKGLGGLLPGYRPQMGIYEKGTGLPGLYVLGQKTVDDKTGEVDILTAELVKTEPYSTVELLRLKSRLKGIVKRALEEGTPECTGGKWPCPVWENICGDNEKVKVIDRKPRVPDEVVDMDQVDKLVAEMAVVRDQVKELEKTKVVLEARNKEITKELVELFDDYGVSIPATQGMKKGTVTGSVVEGTKFRVEEVRRWMNGYTVESREQRYFQLVPREGEKDEQAAADVQGSG